ncbi:MAG: type II toxin-antitoxin system PemK/MazF family toxin [Candidatus Woesearchaeota archaeon]
MRYSCGDIILIQMQFADTLEVKLRPAVVLYQQFDNLVVAGITSNTRMKGVTVPKGVLAKESVIKLNYVFTFSSSLVKKHLGQLSQSTWSSLRKEFMKLISQNI